MNLNYRTFLRSAAAILISLAFLLPMACKGGQSNGGGNGKTNLNNGGTSNGGGNGGSKEPKVVITAEDRVNGIISRDVYQVFVTASGSTRSEAMNKGLRVGQAKALNLMRKDGVLRGRRLTGRGMSDLRRLVAANSKVVKLRQEPNGTWSVVMQVRKDGLKSWMRRLE